MLRIAGRSTFERSSTLRIPLGSREDGSEDTITARLGAFPLNVTDYMGARLPEPIAPKRPMLDEQRRPVRDQGRPVYHEDLNDPAYLAAKNHHGHVMSVALFLEVLDDPEWQFATPRPPDTIANSDPAWRAYYEGVYGELVAAEFPAVAVIHIGREIKRLAGITDRTLEEESARFLPARGGTEPNVISAG